MQADHIRKKLTNLLGSISLMFQKIRNRKSSNPKEYWNLLNGQTRSQNPEKPDLDTLKEHFRKLNA